MAVFLHLEVFCTAASMRLLRSAEATGAGIYASLGVRTIVNCKGTFTIIGGSLILPEVKRAMDEASRHYVHIDELMNAVGKRLADLSGAEWGIVQQVAPLQ